jgi:hypothetical protein
MRRQAGVRRRGAQRLREVEWKGGVEVRTALDTLGPFHIWARQDMPLEAGASWHSSTDTS